MESIYVYGMNKWINGDVKWNRLTHERETIARHQRVLYVGLNDTGSFPIGGKLLFSCHWIQTVTGVHSMYKSKR